ncbi:MAG TPA: PASTA domain-containing protein [Pyrinomonadaceae bacterium]|nr:PASTA domain-containing protein [Pyrinomonadaceae bacterium]
MPSFAITPTSDRLEAKTGSAKAVFTVTNTNSRPLRCIVKVRPLGSTQAEWLKIEGETERDFPAAGTHQYTVNFDKPLPPVQPNTTAPAESLPFRLDAISANNPDEDFAESPVVTVEIPERKGPVKIEPWWKKYWWVIAIIALVLLLVGGLVWWLLSRSGDGDKVEVPDVTNRTFAEAHANLRNANLTAVRVDVNAADRERDKVFAQDPGAGSKVNANTNVNVSVPATTTVPRVIGLSYEAARTKLAESDLIISDLIRSRDVSSTLDANQVGFQFPLTGTLVLKGSEVKVFFPCPSSMGRRCLVLDDVLGGKMLTIHPEVLEKLRNGKQP